MSGVTVDASVWISAQDAADPACAVSRTFFSEAIAKGVAIHVPAYARVEIACALARRLQDAPRGRSLAEEMLTMANARLVAIDARLLAVALAEGTTKLLRGADSLYVATALRTGSALISLDSDHLTRAGAIAPAAWKFPSR